MRRGTKPSKARVEPKRPAAPKSRESERYKVPDLEERLAEALKREAEGREQQIATSEILRVISSSPTDAQPVFDAVAENAARLCESFDSAIFRREGERLLLVAHHGPIAIAATVPLVRETFNGRTILDGRTLHVADLQSETNEFPRGSEFARQDGTRAHLSVPLLREGVAIGTISLRRIEPQLFTERQVALLETFANQAAIAIENVRLFTELQEKNRAVTQAHAQMSESLEQQTATSELLKVIGRSTSDLEPVFKALAENAVRLCEAEQASIFRFDGRLLQAVVTHNLPPAQRDFLKQNPIVPGRGSGAGRAAVERRTIHIHDVQADPEYTYGGKLFFRTLLAIPMFCANELLGAISIQREEIRPFTDNHIALMETFADQAVIAIENVRLFTELQEKNQALTQAHAQVSEALEQQTATAEILRVISSSPTDVQPVFDAIVAAGRRLSGGLSCTLRLLEGEVFRLAAFTSTGPIGDEAMRSALLTPVGEPLVAQVMGTRALSLSPTPRSIRSPTRS